MFSTTPAVLFCAIVAKIEKRAVLKLFCFTKTVDLIHEKIKQPWIGGNNGWQFSWLVTEIRNMICFVQRLAFCVRNVDSESLKVPCIRKNWCETKQWAARLWQIYTLHFSQVNRGWNFQQNATKIWRITWNLQPPWKNMCFMQIMQIKDDFSATVIACGNWIFCAQAATVPIPGGQDFMLRHRQYLGHCWPVVTKPEQTLITCNRRWNWHPATPWQLELIRP